MEKSWKIMVLILQSFKIRFVKTASPYLCLLDYMAHFTQDSIWVKFLTKIPLFKNKNMLSSGLGNST